MYKSLLEQIGNTPLAKMPLDTEATVLAKLEYLNPGGSIKDRSALFMVEDAERRGLLKAGGTIVEASSGNQGIALAMIGAHKGYRVIITVPKHTSSEKVATLRAYGAEVLVCPDTDTLQDPQSYHSVAVKIRDTTSGAFMPNQYMNKINCLAHYSMTGPEIWKQTEGRITHFFCGMGSCGTVSGVGRYLKEQNPAVKVIGIDSNCSLLSSQNPSSYESEGIGVDVIGETLHREFIDHIFPVADRDAFQMTRKLARSGFMGGISCGAVFHALQSYLPDFSSQHLVVMIMADSGRAYLSKVFSETALFQEEEARCHQTDLRNVVNH